MRESIPYVVIRFSGHGAEVRSNEVTSRRTRGIGGQPPAASASRQGYSVDEDEGTLEQVRRLAKDPDVFGVAPMMPVSLVEPFSRPEGDPAPEAQGSWGIDAVGAGGAGADGGRKTVVAVLDTGIQFSHPAFRGLGLRLGDNVVNFTSEANDDLHGHGTHCAATIFGRDVEGTRIGIARGVENVLIGKVLGRGGGSTDAIYRGLTWAMSQGAHVISMSLGLDFVGFRQQLVDRGYAERQATSLALAGYRANIRLFDRLSEVVTLGDGAIGGSIVVAAAGNDSQRPEFAITVSPPASGDKFLSVGAIGRASAELPYSVAAFSNDEVKFVGPGEDILSAGLDGRLKVMSGTSMAAPHVAGVAALWADRALRNGNFVARDIIEAMHRSADPLGHLSRRDVGWGMPLAPPASERRMR